MSRDYNAKILRRGIFKLTNVKSAKLCCGLGCSLREFRTLWPTGASVAATSFDGDSLCGEVEIIIHKPKFSKKTSS